MTESTFLEKARGAVDARHIASRLQGDRSSARNGNGTRPRDYADLATDRGRAEVVGEPCSAVALDESISRAQNHLLGRQDEEGFWVGYLGNCDATLVSDYSIMMHFLGKVDPERQRKGVRFILSTQNEEGGWSLYPGGPSNVSATAKAYFALKLAGMRADDPVMVAAKEAVHRLGGLDQVNSYTKIYLAMFGVFKWSEVPAVPPELMFLPKTFYFNLYEISSWSRAILVPLTIIWAHKPLAPLPEHAAIDELFLYPRQREHHLNGTRHWNLGHFFSSCNELAKLHEFVPLKPWRKTALKQAEKWMLERIVPGGLAAIFPSMLNTVIALHVLGYAETHPKMQLALDEFEKLVSEDDETFRFQPCLSPVWDTALTTFALRESGLAETHPAMERAATWLLAKECRTKGDWHVKNPDGPVSGWYFEFNNEFYPDVDDTAMVMMAIRQFKNWGGPRAKDALQRGHEWLLSMQSDDGGWAAFDRNNNKMVFTMVPFADHNALLDPSTADITGRVLEYLGQIGWTRDHPRAARAIEFLKREQEPEGCWYGRWGVNYIYGTSQALRGLADIGEDLDQPYLQRAADWLESCQNPDGGWGETCASYDDPSLKGQGESTPSQTAWAILGLLAAGRADAPSVERGTRYLTETQRTDGGWDEDQFTGTGFPKVYYLEYTMYRHYFPLMALSQYREKRKQ